MCLANKQFESLKFIFDSVYVDLQYDEISLTFTFLVMEGFDTICTAVCNRCDRYTACRLCRLEPEIMSHHYYNFFN